MNFHANQSLAAAVFQPFLSSRRSIVSDECVAPSSVKPKKERIKRGKDEKEAAVVLTNRQTQDANDEVSVALEVYPTQYV